MKRLLIITILTLASFGTVFAKDWYLPGITIIKRAQRGADESLRFKDPYNESVPQNINPQTFDYDSLVVKQSNAFLDTQRNLYLNSKYPEDLAIDQTITGGANAMYVLRWPQTYHYQKTKIVIHHTAKDVSMFTGINSAIWYLQDVYRNHARKWGDIGYNFLIDPYGNIYEGRAGGDSVIGAHAVRNNTPSIGIALMGNFETTFPTISQTKSLTALLTALTKKYAIDPLQLVDYHKGINEYPYIETSSHTTIAGHKDMGDTECPGKYLYGLLPHIRTDVWVNWRNPYGRDTFKYASYEPDTHIGGFYSYIFQ